MTAAQRKLEVALVQWTSFDDSYGQVEHWLRDMESQLEGQLPLRSTLEEKKTQLQNYKVLCCPRPRYFIWIMGKIPYMK